MASNHQVAGSTPARRAELSHCRVRSSMVEQLPLKESVPSSSLGALTKNPLFELPEQLIYL